MSVINDKTNRWTKNNIKKESSHAYGFSRLTWGVDGLVKEKLEKLLNYLTYVVDFSIVK